MNPFCIARSLLAALTSHLDERREKTAAEWALRLQFRSRYTHPDFWVRSRARSLPPRTDRFHPTKLATMLPNGI